MNPVFISVCIPAYKRVDFLKRLLDSVVMQQYRDFEVIITDDSATEDVQQLGEGYKDKFALRYYRNSVALGMPENWNEAIRQAGGQWIKLMHDDDWFSTPDALAEFAAAVKQNPSAGFFFSAYTNIFESGKKPEIVSINSFREKKLHRDTVTLFSRNVIGPPSVTLVRNDKRLWYDNKVKWVVDIDFYIRYLEKDPPVYIDKPLINVGINKDQVTHSVFRKPEVEIPENFYLLEKTGVEHLKDILIYDAWWRLVRNLKIKSVEMIRANGYAGAVHPVIRSMIAWQSRLPGSLLRTGVFSKSIMFIHFLINRRFLK